MGNTHGGQNALRCVLEITDVHVARRSNRGYTTPARLVRAPHIEEEGCGSAGYSLSMMDYKLAIDIPVNVRRPPHNLKIMCVALVEPGDFRVLEI